MKKKGDTQKDLLKMHEKLNRVIKSIDELRSESRSDEISDRLLQIEMDAISVKKLCERHCPELEKEKGERYGNYPEDAAIMVVDDEEMVLQVTCIIISKMGLRPLAFKSSSKALEYYRENHGKIDLVLLDMIMPEMNGKELFLSLKEINPDVKAILLSGWIDKDENRNIHDIGLVDFLHKPIEKAVLERNIIKALEG